MFTKFDSNKVYEQNTSPGVLPTGVEVKFPDGTVGSVSQGFLNETSLVSFPAGGGSINRDVYDNSLLSVKE